MSLFEGKIENWKDWGQVFQSLSAFGPLAEEILKKENLPVNNIENLTPGTNAVFKVGDYVMKIFAPAESGIDQTTDRQTELFATRRANRLGVSAPKLVADGFVEDKYLFAYLITEYIEGMELVEALKSMSDVEKTDIGKKLRSVVEKMNTPCEPFNNIDVMGDVGRFRRWEPYPDAFKVERLVYLKSHDFGEKVFVHGDLCGDNILITPKGELCIIDFADAVLAPAVYEHALIPLVYEFDPALCRGYFDGYTAERMCEECFDGLLLHDFGGDLVKDLGAPEEFGDLGELKRRLRLRIDEI